MLQEIQLTKIRSDRNDKFFFHVVIIRHHCSAEEIASFFYQELMSCIACMSLVSQSRKLGRFLLGNWIYP